MSEPIRTAVVDDEPIARRIVTGLLAEDPEIEVVAEGDAASLLPRLASGGVDLLFLDIEMPEVGGFDLLAALPADARPVVVFITAYDRYAVDAFSVHAVDYLLKPFTDGRFAAALAHAKQRLRERRGMRPEEIAALLRAARREPEPYLERLLVKINDRTLVVETAAVDWIEAADYYARLHCGEKSYLVREPLASLEERLDPVRFCRVHRSAIVRLDRVREVAAGFGTSRLIVLATGRRVPLARNRRRELERRLGLR